MTRNISYGRQWIDDDDIDAVVNVLKSDFLTCGPKIKEFEDKICEITGAKYAVAISNGTTALHAACFAAGISQDDEVITTPMTFAASANCVLYMGGTPVFADINPDTYNIDPIDIERKITLKTKAIIPVHYMGLPCDMDEINEIARIHNLTVIEDAAHAIGAKYKGKGIGSISDMTTFSFHPVKTITTGEGGAIATNDKNLYEKMLLFRTHGITRDSTMLINNDGPWYYEQQFLGHNYRMTDFQAALGVSQLNKLDMFLKRRMEIVNEYNTAFDNINAFKTPHQGIVSEPSWHIYVLKLLPELLKCNRKDFFEELKSLGIGVNVHYIPVYYHPYYQKLGYQRGACPNAEELYEGIITLPLYPKMTDEDVKYVIECVINTYEKFKKSSKELIGGAII